MQITLSYSLSLPSIQLLYSYMMNKTSILMAIITIMFLMPLFCVIFGLYYGFGSWKDFRSAGFSNYLQQFLLRKRKRKKDPKANTLLTSCFGFVYAWTEILHIPLRLFFFISVPIYAFYHDECTSDMYYMWSNVYIVEVSYH